MGMGKPIVGLNFTYYLCCTWYCSYQCKFYQ